jgi:hypothetical protein
MLANIAKFIDIAKNIICSNMRSTYQYLVLTVNLKDGDENAVEIIFYKNLNLFFNYNYFFNVFISF